MRAALVLLLLAPLAGCLQGAGFAATACPEPTLTTLTGPDDGSGIARAPGEPVPMLYWARNPYGFAAALYGTTLPSPEGALDPREPDAIPASAGIRHDVTPGGLAFAGYQAPVPEAQRELVFQVDLAPARDDANAPDCDRTGVTARTFELASPSEREVGAIGKGILVRTAGFWTNGTSFYTNHAGAHANEGIPKGYLGDYSGDEPLKAYVYAEGETTPPRRYQTAGFGMMISGFNDALQGMPVGTARLVYIEPEDAYTREGREEHPLYGEPLLFWIETTELVDLPCPLPQPACDIPGTPPLPLPPLPP